MNKILKHRSIIERVFGTKNKKELFYYYCYTMLTNIIKSSLCVSKATKASYSFLKSTKSFNAKKLNRNYGIMSFKDVYVKHEYGR